MQITITNGTLTNIQETLSPSQGYALPPSVTVTGATSSYSDSTGLLQLTSPTSSMSVSASGVAVVTPSISIGSLSLSDVYVGSTKISKIFLGSTLLWEAPTPPQPVNNPYLTFESDDGSEFTLGTDEGTTPSLGDYLFAHDGSFEYSTDTINWQNWDPTTTLSSSNGKLYIRGTGNTYLSSYVACFLKGTKITLADGSRKNVEDITYDDVLKVWNFDTGEYDTAPICWLTKPKLKNHHYYKLTFSDGTILKTTGLKSNHKVYNVGERYFKGVNVTEIGDRVFTENGIVTVTNKEYIEEEVLYYNLITSLRFGCFANGILTSDRYGNIYPIDENMMFVKGDRQIRPYSEFEEVGISRYWYDNLRLGENTETLEETKKYIHRLEGQMRERE